MWEPLERQQVSVALSHVTKKVTFFLKNRKNGAFTFKTLGLYLKMLQSIGGNTVSNQFVLHISLNCIADD